MYNCSGFQPHTYRFLSIRQLSMTSFLVGGDVEGVIFCAFLWVVSAIDCEGVGDTPLHSDLRDQKAVDVPCDTPSDNTLGGIILPIDQYEVVGLS